MGRGNNGIGHVWAANTSAGDAGRPNGVGPVWIENISAIGGGGGGGGSFTGVSHDSNLSGDGLNSPLGLAGNVWANDIRANKLFARSGVGAAADADGYFYQTDYGDNGEGWRVSNQIPNGSNDPFGMEVYKMYINPDESDPIQAGTRVTTAGLTFVTSAGDAAGLGYQEAHKLEWMPDMAVVSTSAQATGANILYVVTGSN